MQYLKVKKLQINHYNDLYIFISLIKYILYIFFYKNQGLTKMQGPPSDTLFF